MWLALDPYLLPSQAKFAVASTSIAGTQDDDVESLRVLHDSCSLLVSVYELTRTSSYMRYYVSTLSRYFLSDRELPAIRGFTWNSKPDKIGGVANLPARQNQSSSPTKDDKTREAVADALAKGLSPPEIAKRIAPDDKKRRAYWRKRIWKMVRSDALFHAKLAEYAQGELALGLLPATQRLTKRAARLGKPPEVKLVYEASGFHNSRIQHEHTGDIKVTLDMPRPKSVTSDPEGEEIIDAEVVDED